MRELGVGGMGAVFLCRDLQLDRLAAIKVVSARHISSAEGRQRLLIEARAAARISHPNVVGVYRAGELGDQLYIAYEYVDGIALDELTPLEPNRLLEAALDLARGLAAAHACSVLHRDLKPANAFMAKSGVVKLGDFGLAKLNHAVQHEVLERGPAPADPRRQGSEQHALTQMLHFSRTERGLRPVSSVTEPGAVMGTPYYLPPELWGGGPATYASDLYSLGALLFELACGSPPARILVAERSISLTELGRLICDEPAPRLADVAPSLPGALCHLVDACLRRAPEERPASVHALAEELTSMRRDLAQASLVPARTSVRTMAVGARQGRGSASSHDDGSRFVGRRHELAELERALSAEARLVTLRGPGGAGKTRLALELASRLTRQGRMALFCDLTEARTLNAICGALAQTLDVPLTGTTVEECVEQLGHALASLGNVLVILDNFEQVAPMAEATVAVWQGAAAQARFVVTSRLPIGLPGECVFDVDPLPVPPPGEADPAAVIRFEAVQLFVDRANRVAKDYALSESDAGAIAALVRALDGLPLAIELAAPRTAILTPGELLERLSQRFELLRRSEGSPTDRQATLAGTIGWSWDLLGDHERVALMQLSLFRGGFSIEAAEQVLRLPAGAPPVLDLVQGLREKSLVRSYAPGLGSRPRRCALYESVRDYALERLQIDPSGPAAGEAHQSYFVGLGEKFAAEIGGPSANAALDELQIERDNLLEAAHRCESRPGMDSARLRLRLALALDPLLEVRGPVEVRLEVISRALEAACGQADLGPLLARAIAARGRCRHAAGDLERAEAELEEALASARSLEHTELAARLAVDLAIVLNDRGQPERARELVAQVLPTIGSDESWLRGYAIGNLGNSEALLSRPDQAKESLRQSIRLLRSAGNVWHLGAFLVNLGAVHAEEYELYEARRYYQQALDLFEKLNDRRSQSFVLTNLSGLERDRGRNERARDLGTRALRLAREVGDRRLEGAVLGELGLVEMEAMSHRAALDCLTTATAYLAATGERRFRAIYTTFVAAARAGLDELEEAQLELAEGEKLLAELGEPFLSPLPEVLRGFLDQAAARGDPGRRREHELRAEGRLGAADDIARSDYVRTARRALRVHLKGGCATPA